MSEYITPKRAGAEAGEGCAGHEGHGGFTSQVRQQKEFHLLKAPGACSTAVVELERTFQKAI